MKNVVSPPHLSEIVVHKHPTSTLNWNHLNETKYGYQTQYGRTSNEFFSLKNTTYLYVNAT